MRWGCKLLSMRRFSPYVLLLSIVGIVIIVVLVVLFRGGILGEKFELPQGDTAPTIIETPDGEREAMETAGTKHSIPLNEILDGGPGKDGIPSIDNPIFVSPREADSFLDGGDTGLGFEHNGDARFYPFSILVWHEIVNDTVGGEPVLVSYCPLCLTGIVFDRILEGSPVEFGVSGKLWKSNLLMYNRADDPAYESLWSQVLGEAVVGEHTGTKLTILPSDIVQYDAWKKAKPHTTILSRDTGFNRSYDVDPYGSYYTSPDVGFGADFTDSRLHPKDLVLGIEVDEQFKAYPATVLPAGITSDAFAGQRITIEKNETGEVRMFKGTSREPIEIVAGFWFSWLAVHPETELFQ
jgi:hypothetical protein